MINILVGAPLCESHLPQGITLLIDACGQTINSFTNSATQQGSDLIGVQAVLASYDDQILLWNTYNDSRFDGPISPDEWRTTYKNVKLIRSQEIRGRALGPIVYENLDHRLLQADTLVITLRQGDLVPILSGLGSLAFCVHSIEIKSPSRRGYPDSACCDFMRNLGFVLSSPSSSIYLRDPTLWHEVQNQALFQEVNQLRRRLEDSDAHRQQLTAELHSLLTLLPPL